MMATQVLALELGPPAYARMPSVRRSALTEMGQRVWLDHPDKAAPMLERIPLGRFVYPAEVSEVAVWLASDAAAVVNGVELPVDGGLLVT